MQFNELVDKLYGRKASNVKIKLGLERIEYLCNELGNPQNNYKTIHVAGTNGKGSVTKAISNIFIEQGFKVGTFTSPHLISITERMKINYNNISEIEFVELYEELNPILETLENNEDLEPSFFEIITAMAFKYFDNNNVDIAVIEVGLGGRLDSTNVLNSDVSVITTIDKDHTKTLGEKLEEIAYEKSGIIKKDNIVVVGDVNDSVLNVIKKKAETSEIKAFCNYSRHYKYENPKYSLNWNSIDYKGLSINLDELIFRCNGAYQPHNLSVSIAASEAFARKNKIKIDENKLRKAIKEFSWEGRFELIEEKNKKVILEGAHNIAGIKMLEKTINMYMPFSRNIALIGILDDKDIEDMYEQIKRMFKKIIVTQVNNERSINPKELYYKLKSDMSIDVEYIQNPIEAFNKLLKYSSDYYFVTGSLYLIGEIRGYILKEKIN